MVGVITIITHNDINKIVKRLVPIAYYPKTEADHIKVIFDWCSIPNQRPINEYQVSSRPSPSTIISSIAIGVSHTNTIDQWNWIAKEKTGTPHRFYRGNSFIYGCFYASFGLRLTKRGSKELWRQLAVNIWKWTWISSKR